MQWLTKSANRSKGAAGTDARVIGYTSGPVRFPTTCPTRAPLRLAAGLVVLAIAVAPPSLGAEDAGPAVSKIVAASGSLQVGSVIPGFGGWTLKGDPWSFEKHRAKNENQALVVSFFATWCQPCVKSFPALRQVRKAFPADQVGMVFVSFGEEGQVVESFVEKNPVPGIVLVDPFQKIGERFGVDKSLPRTFVVDPKGVLRAIFVTEGADFEPRLALAVRAALDGRSTSP